MWSTKFSTPWNCKVWIYPKSPLRSEGAVSLLLPVAPVQLRRGTVSLSANKRDIKLSLWRDHDSSAMLV